MSEFNAFYPAENYHQDFVQKNPNHPYVIVKDIPKLKKFRETYPDLLKTTDVAGAQS